ncbi:MAG: DUF971 domain-containing protein [Sinobacterium sp.]|nr:DUF971 domain-containing protein [Sinobacterium sp.]
MSIPQITTLNMQRSDRQLALTYNNGENYTLSYEMLRIHSPSAEVRGHGKGQEVLQLDKQNVMVESIQTVGNYAVQIFFNDGHDSGIYSWEWLYELASQQKKFWQDYLDQLQAAGHSRQAPHTAEVVQMFEPKQ